MRLVRILVIFKRQRGFFHHSDVFLGRGSIRILAFIYIRLDEGIIHHRSEKSIIFYTTQGRRVSRIVPDTSKQSIIFRSTERKVATHLRRVIPVVMMTRLRLIVLMVTSCVMMRLTVRVSTWMIETIVEELRIRSSLKELGEEFQLPIIFC